jgi:hypothetical protein
MEQVSARYAVKNLKNVSRFITLIGFAGEYVKTKEID